MNKFHYSIKGITETKSALDMLLNEGYRGDYRAVPKIAILVTDGKAYRPTETYASAQHAKDSGINLFAVGIGSDINLQELETISSSPSSSHVFLVSEFNKLLSIVSSVAEGTCSGNVLQLIYNVKITHLFTVQ